MSRIIFPLSAGMSGARIADLQDVLHLFLDRAVILPNDEDARRELSEQLANKISAKPRRTWCGFFKTSASLRQAVL
jgi:hypothetical protein